MSDIPKDAVEITAKRTRNAKHYKLADGRLLCRASAHSLHYLDAARNWVDIDTTVSEKLSVERAEYIAHVSPDQVAFTYQSRAGGYVRILLASIEGRPLKKHPLKIKPEREGNKVTWRDILPDLDIELRFFASGAEFFKILKGPRAPRSFAWEYRWKGKIPNINIQRKTRGHDKDGRVKRPVEIVNDVEEFADVDTAEQVVRVSEAYTGRAMVVNEKRVRSLQKSVKYPVVIDASISESITTGADDVEEDIVNTSIATGGSNIKIGYGALTTTYSTAVNQYAGGFRFQSLGIPTGSTVSSATLTLASTGTGPNTSGSWSFNVAADNVDNAAAWSAGNRPTQISKVGQVTLNVATSEGSPVSPHTANVTTAMQAILDRAGWSQNNNVRFGVEPGSGLSESQWLSIEALENAGTSEATLDVVYTVPVQTRQMVWNVQALATAARELVWNVNKIVSLDRELVWNVYVNMDAPVELGLSWDLRQLAGADLDVLWNVISTRDLVEGFAHIHGSKKPVLRSEDKRVDLRDQNLRIRLGKLEARVDAVEVMSLAAAKARPGRLYAVGEEERPKMPGKPAKSQDVALVYILSLAAEDGD